MEVQVIWPKKSARPHVTPGFGEIRGKIGCLQFADLASSFELYQNLRIKKIRALSEIGLPSEAPM
jgi:hypothetical protein